MNLINVSFGGGTNSAAMIIGLVERGERIDYITFADTGGEKPHTYTFIEAFDQYLSSVGYPKVTIVKGSQPAQIRRGSLEAECLELGTMPSKAFGYGNCSQKWKIDPQNKFDKDLCKQYGIKLADITRLVGFDADEPSRADRAIALIDKRRAEGLDIQVNRFPLIEWDWGRDECVEAIARAGLVQPGKSSCWFCPSSKKTEVVWLRDNHPDLFDRAVRIEQRALNGEGDAPIPFNVKGLGRNWSWKKFIEDYDAAGRTLCEFKEQLSLFSDAGTPEVDCGCYDGE